MRGGMWAGRAGRRGFGVCAWGWVGQRGGVRGVIRAWRHVGMRSRERALGRRGSGWAGRRGIRTQACVRSGQACLWAGWAGQHGDGRQVGGGRGNAGAGPPPRPSTLTGPACPRSLPLRFWINIIKNPQLVFDVQTSDSVDAVLLVIAQTFVDACTLADHKLGRVSGPGGLGARVGRPGGARTRSGSLGEERREASDRPWGLGEA